MDWTEDLSVGNSVIDSQHRELFARITRLVDAIRHARCKDEIDDTIRFLEEYASTHFSAEETLMKQYRYPEHEAHRTQHAIFMASLSDLKKLASEPRITGSSYELSVTTNQVVVDWIVNHIIAVDKKLGAHISQGS